jgi:hypothetical protein
MDAPTSFSRVALNESGAGVKFSRAPPSLGGGRL